MTDFYPQALELFPYSQAMRRDFHMHPELGFEEVRTSGIIASELRQLGLEVSTGIAKTGVVAHIEGEKPGPLLMLRFDIDALPIQEQTGAEYASRIPNRMHACGHDGHAAIGLTVAKLLHANRHLLQGTVRLAFQPAEEGAGAGGPVMASAAIFFLRLTGKGGHGAMPHQATDPVVAAAQIISAAQTIVSRNTDPQEACVISFCAIRGGEAFNVIPHTVEMKGTIRTFSPQVEEMAYRRLRDVTEGVGKAMGCAVELVIDNITPAVINDEASAEAIKAAARQTLPQDFIQESGHFTMGAEDFAFYQKEAPGAFFFVGSTNEEKGLIYGHHHPQFDFDEGVLPRAAALMAASAVELLRRNAPNP